MRSNSKNRFLLTTAVLLAGVGLASAQGMREGGGGMGGAGGPGGGAAERGAPGGGMSQGPGAASRGGGEGMTQGRAAEPRAGGRAESPAAGPSRDGSGRAAQGERQMGKDVGQSPRGQRETVGQGRGEREPTRQSEQKGKDRSGDRAKDQAKDQSKDQSKDQAKSKDQTVGQSRGERDKTQQSEQKSGQKDQGTTTGANTRPDNQDRAQQGQTGKQGEGTTTGANTQGQTQDQRTATQSASGRFTVSAQQQTRLQQSVLSSRNVARVNVNSINFRISTGVVVPRSVSFVSVAAYPVLIDYFPAYRDYSFFVVEDEIVVLDRNRRIVDVVPAGPRARFARGGGSGMSGGSVAALDLSPDEIRIVQRVLIERGILIGEADGVLGPDTRQALITFQRRQGIEVSGSIDTRTVAALGVSNRISATQGQSTTVGQGQGGQSTGQGQANAPAQNQPATGQAQQNQPPTSGQAGTKPQQGQTTGQAPAQPQGQTTGQAPAQGGNPPNTNQNAPSGQTNQNNAPPPPASGQPAQTPSSR